MTDIVPSFMAYGGHDPSTGTGFDNWRLRVGEVQEAIPPTDPRNVSKRVTEYRVYVQQMSGNTMVGRVYDYCTISNMFGSLADHLEYSLRAVPSASNKDSQKNSGAGKGAKVLLLCINGSIQNAVIIGAIRDSNQTPETPGKGQHLDFVFNGVSININDSGELSLKVAGKTDLDGKTINDDVGSSVKIDAAGNVSVSVKNDVNVNCSKATITADKIQLGEDGIELDPTAGVVLGQAIEPLTGKFGYQLGWTSLNVTAKK
jgi:hypothetical protein